ncbi:Asp-tRNA(Asn)/Glu-tRNA(Gln) amidotransferase subunit GatB [bacterium]|nr:Asp-tRNA(Asn)/Glu-tRNA(Gln) amidotransferase subunit GatB [bacterium]
MEAVIGLEVHIQLSTKTKAFCSCKTTYGNEENTQTCPVCLGMPGALPVLNKEVVDFAIKLGLATNSKIAEKSIFSRKNYFYPDLTKGYQISQYDKPILENGKLEIETENGLKSIGITRIHIEEDTGKSNHSENFVNSTGLDFNRCGTALLEIVSEPEIKTSKEASAYLAKLRQLVRYLEICDGNLEEGSMRCDANISVRETGSKKFGTRVEVKNMNSYKNVEKAIDYEIARQIKVLENGGKIIQMTALWNADKNQTIPMRTKEDSQDYRYFPEPDLVPLLIDENWIDEIRKTLPELPKTRKERFTRELCLSDYEANVLTSAKELADYFEKTLEISKDPKLTANFVSGEVLRLLKETKSELSELKITPEKLGKILTLLQTNKLNLQNAKKIFDEIAQNGSEPEKIMREKGLEQSLDTNELETWVSEVLAENPNEALRFKSGETKLQAFFMGKIMQKSRGKANAQLVTKVLLEKLK